MKQHNIFPECNVDTNLIGLIIGGYSKHKSTCNEVVKAVNGTDCFAIGIIDADKRPATMDKGFVEFKQSVKTDGKMKHLTMFVHNDGKRFMFTVKPAMDKFILHAAKSEGVKVEDYGFPSDFDSFRKITKSIQAADDSKLRQLFSAIMAYPELERFRNTLKYLMHEQYDADPAIAQQFFDGTLTKKDLIGYLMD